MAHYGTATFFGYRALPLVVEAEPARPRRIWPGMPRWILRLQPDELDLLSPSYHYTVFSGVAPDDYPDAFVDVGFLTTKIHCRIWDNPAEVVLSYDGSTAVSEEYTEQGFHRLKMARGFMIRNFIPGMVARYQFTFY